MTDVGLVSVAAGGSMASNCAVLVGNVVIAAFVLAGCADDAGSESDVDSDLESSQGVTVDVSIVDAVAPYDAESQLSADIIYYRLQRQEGEALDDCVESKGLPPIGMMDGTAPPDELGSMLPDFPDLDGLEQRGFRPLTEDDFWTDGESNVLSSEQQAAMSECSASDSYLRRWQDLRDDYSVILSQWDQILVEVDSRDEIVGLRGDFSSCAADEGIAPQHAADEDTFLGALQGSGGPDDLEQTNQERRELGQIYYQCGKDLFERKIELRSGDRRDAFLDEYWDDIVALSEALYGEGLLDDDEGASGGLDDAA